jgi:hypothetical protein
MRCDSHPNKVKESTMTFAFIPKAAYKIGQIIQVHGAPMRVESFTHSGRNLEAVTLPDAPRFRRVLCICTDMMGVSA